MTHTCMTALSGAPSKPQNSRELPSRRLPDALVVAVKVMSRLRLAGPAAAAAEE